MEDKVELLAPAGTFDALVAAVQNGADAVYMGGTKFNARSYADNFTEDKLVEAIEYAHLYGVRIYITLNTLIKEKEIDELRRFLDVLYRSRVDGVILQDMGAFRIIKREYPRLDIHASTQMTIHSLEGVQTLEEMGFKRVVLSRELSLDEIKYIKDNSKIELETFIHGALCICYSGQCLMSSIFGGRSGNRGMCAQPCRLPWIIELDRFKNQNPKYYLSSRDLSSFDFLDDIINAGVNSLKIEGRMKRPEYVAVVTRGYRDLLDSIKTGSQLDRENIKSKLMQIFNRGGFSKGYYYGTSNKTIISMEKPNHWGILVGSVVKTMGKNIRIKLEDELQVGDGIVFRQREGTDQGQTVNKFLINDKEVSTAKAGQVITIPVPKPVSLGTQV